MAMRSFWFGPPGSESFACLHLAAPAADTGLVICSAFGREELTAHRTLRHVAEDAAARGVPALRFDYPCTGDSAGSELDEGQVARWTASIGTAIDVLRQQSGVRRVVVLGFRIGALLALQALQGREDVAGLVCFAAPASGRAYVRELRMAGQSLARDDAQSDDGVLESGGYAMPADCQQDLAAVRFRAGTLPAGCPVLAIERDDRPSEAPWLKDLEAAGHPLQRVTLNGYMDMMAASFRSVVPHATVTTLVDWIAERARSRAPAVATARAAVGMAATVSADATASGFASAPATASAQPATSAAETAVTSRLLVRSAGGTVRETLATIDPDAGLVGVLSEPVGTDVPPLGQLLLLPPGADRRLGPGRLYVQLARELAAHGYRVLRLDISGVGDSPARPGCAENAIYQPEALHDVALACRFLHRPDDDGPLHLVGHCSGAYNALKGTLANPVAASITLINPVLFFYKPGMSLEDPLGQSRLATAAVNYRQNLFSRHHWDRILREPHRLVNVMNVLVRWPLTRLRGVLRSLASACGARLEDDLGHELRELARAGVAVNFCFATGDPGETLLKLQGGRAVNTLQSRGKLTVKRIPGADHDLSSRRDRVLLLQHLMAMLGRDRR